MNQISWKKVTATGLYLIGVLLAVALHTINTPEAAAAVVASLLGLIAYLITQGKVDLAKLQQAGIPVTAIEQPVAALIKPLLDELQKAGALNMEKLPAWAATAVAEGGQQIINPLISQGSLSQLASISSPSKGAGG